MEELVLKTIVYNTKKDSKGGTEEKKIRKRREREREREREQKGEEIQQ